MGKKSNRDAESTKRHILSVAEEVFAEKGFVGTTVRQISERSGCSGPLILFHFKNKKNLYEEVKKEIVARWDISSFTGSSDLSFESFLRNLVVSTFDFYRENPRMLRIANWGRLEGDNSPWSGEENVHAKNEKIIKEAQRRGEIRDDVTPLALSTMISGSIHVWWEYRDHLMEHVKANSYDPLSDDDYLDQVLRMILRGLRKE